MALAMVPILLKAVSFTPFLLWKIVVFPMTADEDVSVEEWRDGYLGSAIDV